MEPRLSKPQAIQDNLKRKKFENSHELNNPKPKKIKLEQDEESKSKISHLKKDITNLQNNNSSNNRQAFECKLCEKKFYVLLDVKRHVAKLHKIDSDKLDEYVIIQNQVEAEEFLKLKNSVKPILEISEHFGNEKNSKIENDLLILNKARPDIVPLLKNENEKLLTSNQDGTFTCVTCGEILDNLTIAKAHHGECIGGIDENEMPRLEKQIFNSETFHENLEKKNSAKEIKESKISLVGNNKSDDKTKRNRSTMKQQLETVKEQVSVKKVEKNSELEQNNVEYKTYFHCINCNTDVFKNTEAFVHLGKLFVYVNWETNILYCKV